MNSPDGHSTPEPEVATPQALEALAHLPGLVLAESAEGFAELLRQVVTRVLGEGPAAEQALAEGGFIIDGCTVALRRNPDNDFIEVFCDIGLPDPHFQEAGWRTALELNLTRAYPGITLGIHPQSGRLVATMQTHALMLGDADTCVNLLRMLAIQVQRLRDSRVIALQEA